MSPSAGPSGRAVRVAVAQRSSGHTPSAAGFTRADLITVMTASPEPGVSIFLPTHLHGREVQQGPIRLANLVREARELLLSAGLRASESDMVLAPASRLVEDDDFWQHQNHGLAVFLNASEVRVYRVPLPLSEQVAVGVRFHVRPLLPLLAADGRFQVLTMTAGKVRLFQASRHAMLEQRDAPLPESLVEEMGPQDYENLVQASPVARPHTGSIDISSAQVYGDSPAEWAKSRLVEFTRRVAAAVDDCSAADPVPLVLVAGSEIAGHFKRLSSLGPLLAGVAKRNPEAMNERQLHEAAYDVIQPLLDADRRDVIARFGVLFATGDARAAAGLQEVVWAAQQGRVDTLLLPVEDPARGHDLLDSDEDIDQDEAPAKGAQRSRWAGQDLLEVAAVETLRHGGRLHLLDDGGSPQPNVGAILRY